jgi:hypothetical protein
VGAVSPNALLPMINGVGGGGGCDESGRQART